jgi:hypothetical protein
MLTLPRLGAVWHAVYTSGKLSAVYTSGKLSAVYYCQQHDCLLVILAQTFNKQNNSYWKSFCSDCDDAVTSDSDTELGEDSDTELREDSSGVLFYADCVSVLCWAT